MCWIYVDAGIGLWKGDVEEVDIEDLAAEVSHGDRGDARDTPASETQGCAVHVGEDSATLSATPDVDSVHKAAHPTPRQRRRLGCVACPAHSWVFELSTGACITNRSTRPARVHRTHIDEAGVVSVSIRPVQPGREDVDVVAAIPKAVADKIQLDMVATALAKKFPDSDSESD